MNFESFTETLADKVSAGGRKPVTLDPKTFAALKGPDTCVIASDRAAANRIARAAKHVNLETASWSVTGRDGTQAIVVVEKGRKLTGKRIASVRSHKWNGIELGIAELK